MIKLFTEKAGVFYSLTLRKNLIPGIAKNWFAIKMFVYKVQLLIYHFHHSCSFRSLSFIELRSHFPIIYQV